jgi:hypothetical protein
LDLPEPFGPTTQVMPGSRRNVVAEAKDLKPRRVRFFRYTCTPLLLASPELASLCWPHWPRWPDWLPRTLPPGTDRNAELRLTSPAVSGGFRSMPDKTT